MRIPILRITIAIFFICLGLAGILPNVDESIFSLGYHQYNLEVVFGVIEVLCGIILLTGFMISRRSTLFRVTILVFILWVLRIILSQLVFRYFPASFEDMLARLIIIAAESVIAAGVWVLTRTYD